MISVQNLFKNYGDKQILTGLNLEILSAETLVILGRSGTGKSVLLRMIIGIEKPDRGTITLDDVELTSLSGGAFYHAIREMGMLFQASALFDSMTVGENTAFYLRQHEKYSDVEIAKKVNHALKRVGLEGTENLMPSDLSGGMRKRAALARLIVYHPKVLLYDEPTTGLDPITAMQINDLILQIQKDLNATSIVVTHDICSAFHVADRIAFIHDGKIPYIGTKKEFLKIQDPIIKSFLKNSIPNGEMFS